MQIQLLITTLLVVSAFAAEKSDAKQKDDKKNVKRGVFGLGYGGYGGYGGLGGYSGGLGGYGGSYHGGSVGGYHGGSLGYYGGGGHGYSSHYSQPAAHYSSLHVSPHTHSHSVETKIVPQVRIFDKKSIIFEKYICEF